MDTLESLFASLSSPSLSVSFSLSLLPLLSYTLLTLVATGRWDFSPASSTYGVPPLSSPTLPPPLPIARSPLLGQRDVILERSVRVLCIRLSAVPCRRRRRRRRHIPYLRRVGRDIKARSVTIVRARPAPSAFIPVKRSDIARSYFSSGYLYVIFARFTVTKCPITTNMIHADIFIIE